MRTADLRRMKWMTDEQPTIGKRGWAISSMFPSRKVLIDGIEYSARFKAGFAESVTKSSVLMRLV